MRTRRDHHDNAYMGSRLGAGFAESNGGGGDTCLFGAPGTADLRCVARAVQQALRERYADGSAHAAGRLCAGGSGWRKTAAAESAGGA